MSDRVKGLVVTIKDDVRIDDIQPLIDAISMLKGVVNVEPNISDINDHINRQKVYYDVKNKIYQLLKDLK